jgi:hypothetical protein
MPQAPINNYANDDIKLTDVIRSFSSYSVFVLKKFWIVLIGVAIMGTAGYLYATLSKVKYQANASFNVVDSKGMGSIGGLLSGLGVSVGSTSNDVLSGIIQSRHAIKSAFLTEVDYQGGKRKLVDIYIDVYGFREDWQEIPDLKDFEFKATNIFELTRKEDSLLNVFWKPFYEDLLEVEFEMLEGLIKASVKTYSYELSQGMLTHMLDYSSKYFTDKQISSQEEAYELSEYKVDSMEGVLASMRYRYAQEQNKSPFVKDATYTVEMNRLATEIANLSIRLGGSKEGLDATKMALMQDKPVINVIDHPQFATDVKIKKWKLWTIIGALVGMVLSIIILLLYKAAIDGFESEKIEQNQLNLS